MKVEIKKGSIGGAVRVPSSKSFGHRMLICAALSDGRSLLSGLTPNEDIYATVDCLSALGAKISLGEGVCEVIGGAGRIEYGAHLPCRQSGSTLRFILPLVLLSGQGFLEGSPRLLERGVGVYGEIFEKYGILLDVSGERVFAEGHLHSGNYTVRGDVSSQFISGLMFALPLCEGDSTLTVTEPFESRSYVDITVDVLSDFGIDIRQIDKNKFYIKGSQRYIPHHCEVEGDWSSAAFWYCFRALGADISVEGLKADSRQGDRVCLDYIDRISGQAAPRLDMADCPDLAPALLALAAEVGGAVFDNTARLAIKESDRAAAMAKELAKFGARVTVEPNRVVVEKSELHAPSEMLYSHDDHRITMSMAPLMLKYGGVMCGAEAVAKSYPDFYDRLEELGAEVIRYE